MVNNVVKKMYQMLATSSRGVTKKVWEYEIWTLVIMSWAEMTDTNEVVLSIEMVSLPMGGIMTRIDWVRMIRRMVSPGDMPRDAAASVWPLSTEMLPAPTNSAA